jgi:hypothetical protein
MFIPGITQSQLQTTKHDMNSPVLQQPEVYIEGQIIKIWSQETGQTTIYKTLDRNQG